MSLIGFSQNTNSEVKPVKVSVLKAIAKDVKKCDSLRVAYQNQQQSINKLIENNFLMFNEIQKLKTQRKNAENNLAIINKNYQKQAKKKKRSTFVIVGAGVIGIITGVLISK